MEKVCHVIVDDMGSDNVFWEEIRKEKKKENIKRKICPYGVYRAWGP